MSTCVAEEQLQRFLHKVEQLNALVALIEADPQLRARLAQLRHAPAGGGFRLDFGTGDRPPLGRKRSTGRQ